MYVNGAPERIRTSDPQIRSLMLYPAELRARAEPHQAASALRLAAPPHIGNSCGALFCAIAHKSIRIQGNVQACRPSERYPQLAA